MILFVGSDCYFGYFFNYNVESIVLGDVFEVILEIWEYLDIFNSCIVVLVLGDFLFFGLGRLLVVNFLVEKLRFYFYLSLV